MLKVLWNNLLYEPLQNALAFLVSIVPGGDLGVAVIILTLVVKFVLYPLSKKSIESQAKTALLTPEINKIKKSKVSKEEQARLTLELYKKHKTNPFSGCLIILIQIPIIFALYYVFLNESAINPEILYSFIPKPENINPLFLGFIDITQKSLPLAILAGISQFIQGRLMPKPVFAENEGSSFGEAFQKSLHMQMKYIFPFFVVIIAYSISGVIALYWFTSNMFAIGQQLYMNKKNKEKNTAVSVVK